METVVGEKFGPHPNQKRLYFTYTAMIVAFVGTILAAIPISLGLYFGTQAAILAVAGTYIPIVIVLTFVSYWIPKFYKSVAFTLTADEVVVERGVWWKRKGIVPYGRVMFVNTVQGPLSRRFGIGAAHIFTAGYTGSTSPSGLGKSEASIFGVEDFMEIRDTIVRLAKGRPLFGSQEEDSTSDDILDELKMIRVALEEPRK